MRVLVISANTERLNMPTMPLGAGLVVGAARAAGHRVELLDLMLQAEPLTAVGEAITRLTPHVIGVSIRNIDDQEMANPTFLLEKVRPVVHACTQSGATVVLGGAGYSIFPAAALEYLGADLGIRGDGEAAFVAVLARLEAGEDLTGLPGVHLPHGGVMPAARVPDLAALPGPVDDLWAGVEPKGADLWIPVQSRRGCANDCSYCSTAVIQGRALRSRPPQQLADHVARFRRRGFEQFYIVDNTFNRPEAHALEVCRLLEGMKVRWRCIIYPFGVSQQLIRAMGQAGCVEVSLGFESGCHQVLEAMNKHYRARDVERVSSMLADQGIRRVGFLLLGGPGETRETVEQSLAFADSLELNALRTTVGIRIYPDTPLAARALQEGQIGPDDDLLRPRFFLAPGLDPWIHQRVTPGFRPLTR